MAGSSKSLSEVSLKEGLVLGTVLTGLGVFIELLSFGVLDPGQMNAPPAIGVIAGSVFLMPGILAIYYAIRNHRRGIRPGGVNPESDVAGWLVSSLMITAFAAIGLWVSIAGKSSAMSGGITGSATEIRIAFGAGAVLCAVGAAIFWSRTLKQIFRNRKTKDEAGESS